MVSKTTDALFFEVPGNPKALKRHRTFRRGNSIGSYNPSRREQDSFLSQAYSFAPLMPFDQPLSVRMDFYFQRPKSHYRSGKHSGELRLFAPVYHTGRPDLDNLIKFIADALNGVFWRDDSLLCDVRCRKFYDDKPRTEIHILPLEQKNGDA